MGNSISSYSIIQQTGGNDNTNENNNNNTPLEKTLDYIASHYILTMDFQSLRKLHEKEYCEELIGLTSKIVDKHFNDLEVNQMLNRITTPLERAVAEGAGCKRSEKRGNSGDDSRRSSTNAYGSLQTHSEDDKQTKCNQIAKFYIKIAHIFSAIVTTVNPEYVYKDATGNIQKHTLNNKNEIPDGVKTSISKLNLCGERINALRGTSSDLELLRPEYSTSVPYSGSVTTRSAPSHPLPPTELSLSPAPTASVRSKNDITIHPEICTINMGKSTLEDEPGIPELIDLYYDDDYDYKTGKFLGMSESTKEQYQQDLKRFYIEFTGSKELSKDISKFSDIKLKDYSKQPYCENSQRYTGKYKDKLFADYANNLKKMVQSVNENQTKLLDIINDLFVYVDDPVTKQQIVRVNPELNNDTLQEVVEKSRNVIIELYLQCEGDFAKGVKLYEAIVESQIFETSKRQIVTLHNAAEKLYMTV